MERILTRRIPVDNTAQDSITSEAHKTQDTVDTGAKQIEINKKSAQERAAGSQGKTDDKVLVGKVTLRNIVEKAQRQQKETAVQYPVGKRTPLPKGSFLKQRKENMKEQGRLVTKSRIETVRIQNDTEIKNTNALSVPIDASKLQPKAALYPSVDKDDQN